MRKLPNKYAVSHYRQACGGMSGRYNTGAKDKYFYVNLAKLITKRCPSHIINMEKQVANKVPGMYTQLCVSCHTINTVGTVSPTSLSTV